MEREKKENRVREMSVFDQLKGWRKRIRMRERGRQRKRCGGGERSERMQGVKRGKWRKNSLICFELINFPVFFSSLSNVEWEKRRVMPISDGLLSMEIKDSDFLIQLISFQVSLSTILLLIPPPLFHNNCCSFCLSVLAAQTTNKLSWGGSD